MGRCRQRGVGPLDSNQIITALRSRPRYFREIFKMAGLIAKFMRAIKSFELKRFLCLPVYPYRFYNNVIVVTRHSFKNILSRIHVS